MIREAGLLYVQYAATFRSGQVREVKEAKLVAG
jgi:hypothetical protein